MTLIKLEIIGNQKIFKNFLEGDQKIFPTKIRLSFLLGFGYLNKLNRPTGALNKLLIVCEHVSIKVHIIHMLLTGYLVEKYGFLYRILDFLVGK